MNRTLTASLLALAAAGCGAEPSVPSSTEAAISASSGLGIIRWPAPVLRNNTIDYTQVGATPNLKKIAACNDGRLYGLDSGSRLFKLDNGNWNRLPGASIDDVDPGLRRYFHADLSIACAAGQLYKLDGSRVLRRNDGSDTSPSWNQVSVLGSTKEIGGTTVLAGWWPLPALTALNDDGSVWMSSAGTDWRKQSDGSDLARVAIGGGAQNEFLGLSGGGTLEYNRANGCTNKWLPFFAGASDPPLYDVTAQNDATLYVLDTARTLWKGAINGPATRKLTMTTDDLGAFLGGMLPGVRLDIDDTQGTFTPSGVLGAFGVKATPFGVPEQDIVVPLPLEPGWDGWHPVLHDVDVTVGHAWIHDVHLGDDHPLGADIGSGGINLHVKFEEDGPEIQSATHPLGLPIEISLPDFDIDNFSADAQLGFGPVDQCYRRSVQSTGFNFNGTLRASSNVVQFALQILGAAKSLNDKVKNATSNGFAQAVAQPEVAAALDSLLLTWANQRGAQLNESYSRVVGSSVAVEGNSVTFLVERK